MDLTVQAMSGVMSATGFPDEPPVKSGAALSDILGGATLTVGVLGALYERERSGRGQHVEVAMQDAVIPSLASPLGGYFEHNGTLPERTGNRHSGMAVAPYSSYPCSNGWVTICCVSDNHWEVLVDIIGRDDLVGDERYLTVPLRAHHMDAIDAIVKDWTSTLERDDVIAQLLERRIPCAPVRHIAELVNDVFTKELGMLPEVEHPTMGTVRVFGNPVRMSRSTTRKRTPAPLLGQHTAETLSSFLHLDDERINELRENGVIN
jgi:formyl-CoA transferase